MPNKALKELNIHMLSKSKGDVRYFIFIGIMFFLIAFSIESAIYYKFIMAFFGCVSFWAAHAIKKRYQRKLVCIKLNYFNGDI